MHSISATPPLILINDVIMHQRPGVEYLDCCGGWNRDLFVTADRAAREQHHRGAQRLSLPPAQVQVDRIMDILRKETLLISIGPDIRINPVAAFRKFAFK